MAQITDTPDEILLEFFAYLSLNALIAARGVNRHWRQLVLHADILPARRALFNLYHTIIEYPVVVSTQQWIRSGINPFDRQAYLDALLVDHPYLPEDFCIWILEWPACAAIRCTWRGVPGVPVYPPSHAKCDKVGDISAFNMLRSIPPPICTVRFDYNGKCEFIPALCLWTTETTYTWLILDERDGLRGKVYELPNEDNSENPWDCYEDTSFIDWLEHKWNMVTSTARSPEGNFPFSNMAFEAVRVSEEGSVEYPIVSYGGAHTIILFPLSYCLVSHPLSPVSLILSLILCSMFCLLSLLSYLPSSVF